MGTTQGPYKCPVVRFPVSEAPLQDITTDFTDVGVGQVLAGDGGKVHSWVEAVSCKNESAQTVEKWLVGGPEEHMLR